MIVDDEKMITTTLAALIKMALKCSVISFNDPLQALESEELSQQKVDLVISDFMMPKMDGIEFLKNIKKKSPESVTILLTGYADKENAIKSINEVGLYYYMEKPWDNSSLIKVIQNGLERKELSESLKATYAAIKESKEELERLYELLKRDYQKEVESLRSLVISFANIIEAKDKYTDGHTRRVGSISRLLGMEVGMTQDQVDMLEIAGIIHDIGKVGIPEHILNKPGKLTDEEFQVMKKHSAIGETICKPLVSLQKCLDPIRHHHEKLNGTGYPDGLKESEISLEARILAIADIFDALSSERPYRAKLPTDKVKEIMQSEADAGYLDEKLLGILFILIDRGEIDPIING